MMLILALLASQLDPNPRIRVGPNVHVSRATPNYPMRELRVCANPKDARDLFVIGMVYIGATNFMAVRGYRSRDGGASWSLAFEPPETPPHQADCECTYTADGTLLATYLSNVVSETPDTRLYDAPVYRLAPGATKWTEIRVPLHDGPFMSVDLTGGSHHGTIYLADDATNLQTPGLFRSTDDGLHFEGPVEPPHPSTEPGLGEAAAYYHVARPGQSTVLLGGILASPRVWFRGDPTRVYAPKYRVDVIFATEGGTRFLTPSLVEEQDARICYVTATSLAQDQTDGPFRGRLYLAWAGIRGAYCEILLAHSDDTGRSWSSPVMLTRDAFRSDARPGSDHELPYVAVNARGIVGVSWYDFRDDADPVRHGYRLRFAASADGGDTFAGSVPVASVPTSWPSISDVGFQVFPPGEAAGGQGSLQVRAGRYGDNRDTNGLKADLNGVFHPIWVDNRTGVAQVWTAAVRVDGSAVRHGARALADLEDVTSRVDLVISNVAVDVKTREIRADYAIKNISDRPLSGPLFVRVVALPPTIHGAPSIVGSANGESGVGAILDFTKTLVGTLAPGDTSSPKRVVLRVGTEQRRSARPTKTEAYGRSDDPFQLSLPALDLRVYGKADRRTGGRADGLH